MIWLAEDLWDIHFVDFRGCCAELFCIKEDSKFNKEILK